MRSIWAVISLIDSVFFLDWRLFVKYILQSELGAMGEVLGVCGVQHTTA